MTKDKGLIKSYSKATVDNMNFVRVSNLTEDGELINITMYLETVGKYKKVYPEALPYDVVNKLSLEKNYKEMSEEEVQKFSKTIEQMVGLISEKNVFRPFQEMEIGLMLDIPYVATRLPDVNLRYINGMMINEFSIIEHFTGFPPQELPYLLMKFIEDNKKFQSETYLVDDNIFVHLEKVKDDYLAIIYELIIEDEKTQKAKLRVINSFTIVDKEGKFILITDDTSELAIKLTDEEFNQFNERFTQNVKLTMFNE